MQSFREKYFEEHKAVPYTDAKGNRKVRYVYSGDWCRWGLAEQDARNNKRLYAVLEAAGLAVYFAAAVQPVRFNSIRAVSGLSILSLIAWAAALRGVAGFLFSKEYITEQDRSRTDSLIRGGSLLHALLMGAAAIAGLVLTVLSGGAAPAELAAAGGHLLPALASVIIFRRQRQMFYRTYRNENGAVGKEIG